MSTTPTPLPSAGSVANQVVEFLGGELARNPTVLKLAGLGAVVAAAIPGDISSTTVRAALVAVGGVLTAVVHFAEAHRA